MKKFYPIFIATLLIEASQNAFAQWKPTSGKHYEFSNLYQKWILEEGYQYSYDTAGNMTMMKDYNYEYDDQEDKLEGPFFQGQTEHTYDAQNRLTGYVLKAVDDYGDLREAGSCAITYDETDKDIITSFERTNNIYTLEDYAPEAYYRTITRDANGNITKILISGYLNGELMDIERVTMTYKDNKPITIKEETKLVDVDEDFSEGYGSVSDDWQTFLELTDIEWESTGNHLYLVIQDPFLAYEELTKYVSTPFRTTIESTDETNWLWFTKIVEGDYRIKSATYKQTMYGYTIKASLSATYDSDGGYELTLNASAYGMKEEMKKKYTDKNGSFVYTDNYTEDGELTDMYKLVLTKDEHGYTTEDIAYDNNGEGDPLEVASSNYYSYTYYKDTDEFASITSGNDKYVYDDFIDVTKQTGISKVTADKRYPTSIFDINGRKIGTSLDNLKSHKGLLIVKQGDKTQKMIVK